ncbi:hypothetical protein K3729_17035 [Rhodobacteraceae bacterium S2214]|nr:hypothetical protein K3729_17035 [Rhodobacteraceae bacterium S2214]
MSKEYDLPDLATMGIEEEHFVVSKLTGDLVSLTEPQFKHLAENLGDKFSREYKACQIELLTEPAIIADMLYADITTSRQTASLVLAEYGLTLFTGSTHPYGRWLDQPAREDARYSEIEARLGQAVKQLLVSGLHIHIGTFDDSDTPIHRMAQYWPVTPILIAANASSPMWEGQDTGCASYRRNILFGLGSQCPPPATSRAQYDAFIDQQVAVDAAKGESDLWLDIRPGRAGLNTVEMRAADIAEDATSNVALATFMQGLEFVARVKPRNLAPFFDASTRHWLEQNCRLAAKHGLAAEIYDPYSQRPCSLRDFAADMLDIARPGISASGNANWFHIIENLICPPDEALSTIQKPIAI